jgi:hypothetical protein
MQIPFKKGTQMSGHLKGKKRAISTKPKSMNLSLILQCNYTYFCLFLFFLLLPFLPPYLPPFLPFFLKQFINLDLYFFFFFSTETFIGNVFLLLLLLLLLC